VVQWTISGSSHTDFGIVVKIHHLRGTNFYDVYWWGDKQIGEYHAREAFKVLVP